MFAITKHWKEAYPEASVAVFILRNVKNMQEHPGLEKSKRILENELRLRFTETSKFKSLKETVGEYPPNKCQFIKYSHQG